MIARYATNLARRLLAWALPSALLGVVLLVAGDDFWRGFGLQAALWGLIDAVIALVALRGARRDRIAGDEAAQAVRIRRILWLNTGLDVVYVAIGAALLALAGDTNPFLAGNGWGVIVQGGFLLVFDLAHARRVPVPDAAVKSFDWLHVLIARCSILSRFATPGASENSSRMTLPPSEP